jgi:hypothetical protein
MAEKKRQGDHKIVIISIRRDPPDYHKLGRAFIAAALRKAEAEAAAEAEHIRRKQSDNDAGGGDPQQEEES